MKNKMSYLILGILVLAAEAFAGGSSTVGPGNPSSIYCGEQGGASILVDENGFGGAQFGLCRLSDNSLIEEWTYFRQKSQETMAIANFRTAVWHTYENVPIEKWAALNCKDLGGNLITATEHSRPSLRYESCQFADRSMIEIWTLFSGPGTYPELLQ